ncbi:MAG: 16S rRNA (guanine(966)-N(2))-methyltransferase RsmD [Ignavibacteria bacterium GWB2_35_6b]|nr:MAG: 16S rRNA (guanine(966)-N(2))-methyltransferase RsmD [Ignavibacteria bacterium GWB2_35_6b]
MRIISGKFKGRVVKMPKSDLVRPTTDRNKESLFNYLNNIIDFDGIKVCDIYAGSGALGLEALSRGAGEVHFVEKNFPVYKTLQENIISLGVESSTKIFKMEAVKFTTISQHEQYDLILADPPFFKDDIHKALQNLLQRNYLKEEGLIIIERSIQTEDKDVKAFKKEPFKKMGDSLFYQFDYSFEN